MARQSSGNSMRSATGLEPISSDVPFGRCVALLCSADITATITCPDESVTPNVPLQKGYNYIQATKVVFSTGAIIAMYN